MATDTKSLCASLLAMTRGSIYALIIIGFAVSAAKGEEVCYFSSANCTGPAACGLVTPNGGVCTQAPLNTTAMLQQTGPTYAITVYPDPFCIAPMFSMETALNACTPISNIPVIDALYVRVAPNPPNSTSSAGGTNTAATAFTLASQTPISSMQNTMPTASENRASWGEHIQPKAASIATAMVGVLGAYAGLLGL